MKNEKQEPIQQETRNPVKVEIELLALDLNSCGRCTGSRTNIETAIGLVRPVLEALDLSLRFKETLIESEAEAEDRQFTSSPTIRINGADIAPDVLESSCESCGDLCACEGGVDCRIWSYRGEEHTEAPVGLILESILGTISGEHSGSEPAGAGMGFNGIPENLQRFFQGMANMKGAASDCCPPMQMSGCCSSDDTKSCC